MIWFLIKLEKKTNASFIIGLQEHKCAHPDSRKWQQKNKKPKGTTVLHVHITLITFQESKTTQTPQKASSAYLQYAQS